MNIFVLAFLFLALAQAQPNPRPVIGILSIPSEYSQYPASSWSYSPSSYAKNMESGGAEVVPLQYDMPKERLTFLLERINGVMFHGGDSSFVDKKGNLTPLGATMDFIVKYVIEQNNNGKHYPLWGTCLGFQAIGGLIQGNFDILTSDCVGCSGVNHNNYFDESYESKLYAGLPEDLRVAMQTANISVFSHGSDFHWDTFKNAAPLNATLRPITWAFDNRGLKYVSSYESPTMPIFGTQYHQEKSTFEWKAPYYINHGSQAVRLQQYLANFFVNETRYNTNTFPEVQDYLIENYSPKILPYSNFNFSSIYLFPSMKTEEKSVFLSNIL